MLTAQRVAILCLFAVGVLGAGNAAKSQPRRAPLPKSVDEIPVASCTVDAALDVSYAQSMQREAASAQIAMNADEKMGKLMHSLPKVNAPVSKLMNSDQTAEFEQLRVQMIIQSMNQLAESRLQRDDLAMMYASNAIKELQNGAADLRSKTDPSAEGAGLVGLLRKLLEKDQSATFPSPDPNVCSIDLALYNTASATMRTTLALVQSPEAKMLVRLRKKYGITGFLDPNKLPSPDKEQAMWLIKAVGNPIQRGVQAAEDWANLLWYAKASQLEYQSLRNDIINGGGSLKYDYDTTINNVVASADPATKHAVAAWNVIEKAVPSEHQLLMKKLAAFANQAQATDK